MPPAKERGTFWGVVRATTGMHTLVMCNIGVPRKPYITAEEGVRGLGRVIIMKTQQYTPSDNKTAEGSAALNRHRHRTTVNFLLCQTCRIVQYMQAVAQLPHACQHGSVAVDVGVAARLNDLRIFPTCRVYVFISAFIKCLPRNLCPHLALSYVYGYEFTATLSFIVGKGTFAAYALYRQAIFSVSTTQLLHK